MDNLLLNIVGEQGVVNIIMNNFIMLDHLNRTEKIRAEIKKHRHYIRREFTSGYDKICSERWYKGSRVSYFYHTTFENIHHERLFIISRGKKIGRVLETYLNSTYYKNNSHISNIRYKILFNRNIYHDNQC